MSTELDMLMEEYAETNRRIRELEKAKDAYKVQIQTILTIKELDRYETEKIQLTWKEQSRRELDKPKLEAFLVSQNKTLEEFQKFNNMKILRITVKDKEEDEDVLPN